VVDADMVQDQLDSLLVPGLPQGDDGLSHDLGLGFACQDLRKSGKGVRHILRLPLNRCPKLTRECNEL